MAEVAKIQCDLRGSIETIQIHKDDLNEIAE